ncbi:MAG: hypothetical protein A3G75_07210 [Verrucomicrobia bacterium RIFCSPLOWO2_12_FULL_64_8]|nr:MAG: hypothetical protein A3G75_07210 [Verrucomicrobia bacterium RIFCSPLOWO2_12_FULL_64_8]
MYPPVASVPALKTAVEPEFQKLVFVVPPLLLVHFLLGPVVAHVPEGDAPAPAVLPFVSQYIVWARSVVGTSRQNAKTKNANALVVKVTWPSA